MNNIKCPNCGKEISLKSSGCIYCGISKNILEEELKRKEIEEIKEISSEVEGFYNNHKNHILLGEIIILVLIAVIYAYSYVPKMLEFSKVERLNKMIEKCSDYGGKWNNDNYTCETEFGIMNMK